MTTRRFPSKFRGWIPLFFLVIATKADPWQECGARFKHALANHDVNGNVSRYHYTGNPRHLLKGGTPPLLVTYEGCRTFCGTGRLPYDWKKIVESLLTWTLPLGALLLQAPFESNRMWATYFLLARWLGNPIVAIGCTLANIRITSRCAALLDRSIAAGATPGYEPRPTFSRRRVAEACGALRARLARWLADTNGVAEPRPPPRGDGDRAFSDFRDSLYALSVLNQFQLNDGYTDDLAAFIQHALFASDGASAAGPGDGEAPAERRAGALRDRRASLAVVLRAARKHGVVPVLFTLLGFALALGISISGVFGGLGRYASMDNLVIGLLLSWLPVLVGCTLLDRNPSNTTITREALQSFFDDVMDTNVQWRHRRRRSLPPALPPVELGPIFAQTEHAPDDGAPTEPEGLSEPNVSVEASESESRPLLVLAFSGQARRKWHSGVADSILTAIESKVTTDCNWPGEGIRRRDEQNIYLHLYSSGAFARTETLKHGAVTGLGWRPDTVIVCQALAALLVVGPATFGAFVVAYNVPPVGIGCRSGGSFVFFMLVLGGFILESLGGWLHRRAQPPTRNNNVEASVRSGSASSSSHRTAHWASRASQAVRVILTLLEVCSSAWLLGIVLAPSFGWYNTCFCRANMWTGRWSGDSGFVDFEHDDYYRQHYSIRPYWVAGTVLGCVPLGVVLYAVVQWCQQSFLWSVDYAKAMRGLRRVRRVRYLLGARVWRDGFARIRQMLGRKM